MTKRRVARYAAPCPFQSREPTTTDAERQTHAVLLAVHHAAIPVVKTEQGHQAIREFGLAKVRLEGEPIGGVMRLIIRLCRQTSFFPRPMGGNGYARLQHLD